MTRTRVEQLVEEENVDRQTVFLAVFALSAIVTIGLLTRVLLGPDTSRRIPRGEWLAVALAAAVLVVSGVLMLSAEVV
jgi:hypothetical protein